MDAKERLEELQKIEAEYKAMMEKSNKVAMDALEKEKQDRIITAILEKMNGTKPKMVFGTPKEKADGVDAISFARFLKMLRNSPEVLKTVMSEGTPADGGYAVPVEYIATILGALTNEAVVPAKATIITQNSNVAKIPKWLSNASTYWVAEDGTKTLTKPTLAQVTLTLKKLACIIPYTDELLDDNNVDLGTKVEELVGKNFGLEIERVALVGNTGGGDAFDGVLYATGVKDVPQAGANLNYEDLVNACFNPDVLRQYRTGAEWFLNTDALRLVMKLKDDESRPIWNMGNMQAGLPATILGKIYNETDQIATATTTSILYGNPKTIYLGNPKANAGINVAVSNSAVAPYSGSVTQNAFMQDETWYRFVKRQSITIAIPEAWTKLTVVK